MDGRGPPGFTVVDLRLALHRGIHKLGGAGSDFTTQGSHGVQNTTVQISQRRIILLYQVAAPRARQPKRRSPLDSRREQNMGIVLRALRLSPEEAEIALMEVSQARGCLIVPGQKIAKF